MEARMHFDKFSFGALRIDDSTYEQDVVIDRGENPQTQEGIFQEIP
jgi:hypothetical protein